MDRRIVIARSNNWQGLYIDGRLAVEGHALSAGDVLAALGINQAGVTVDEKWLAKKGSFPMELKDVKRA